MLLQSYQAPCRVRACPGTQVTRDFLAEQKELTKQTMRETRTKLKNMEAEPEPEAKYVYSGQKLQVRHQ